MVVEIFCCYALEDEEFLNKLKTYLKLFQQDGFIDVWYDREISAGVERTQEIQTHLNTAQVILLLVSQYFLNSDYCYGVEMKRAIERHELGEARVIPVILRPVYWDRAPFAMLQVLPTDARPVQSWGDLNDAFQDVAEGIRKLVKVLTNNTKTFPPTRESRSDAKKTKSHVLIVDDNPRISHLLETMLSFYEYSSYSVLDVTRALEYIQNHQPNIIILDLEISGMSGLEFIRHLRSGGITIPIIIMSVSNRPTIAEALKLGINGVIEKPFTFKALIQSIENALIANKDTSITSNTPNAD